jgi:hypothetical protein
MHTEGKNERRKEGKEKKKSILHYNQKRKNRIDHHLKAESVNW